MNDETCIMCGTQFTQGNRVKIAINDKVIAALCIPCFYAYDYSKIQVEAGDTLTIETPVKVISEVLTEGD